MSRPFEAERDRSQVSKASSRKKARFFNIYQSVLRKTYETARQRAVALAFRVSTAKIPIRYRCRPFSMAAGRSGANEIRSLDQATVRNPPPALSDVDNDFAGTGSGGKGVGLRNRSPGTSRLSRSRSCIPSAWTGLIPERSGGPRFLSDGAGPSFRRSLWDLRDGDPERVCSPPALPACLRE